MRHPLSTTSLLSAAFLATAATAFAAPGYNGGPPPVADGRQQSGPADCQGPGRAGPPGRMRGEGPRGDGPRGDGPRGERPQGPRNPGFDLAARLSAAETYVGVTAAQEDAWRAYTSALIAFFDRPAPPAGGEAGARPGPDGGPQPASPPPAAQAQAAAPPLFSERMAARAIDRGERAKALSAAVETLRSALAPDQLQRLALAESEFRPAPRGPRGPDGDRDGRRDRRDRAGQPPMPPMPPMPGDDMPPPAPEE